MVDETFLFGLITRNVHEIAWSEYCYLERRILKKKLKKYVEMNYTSNSWQKWLEQCHYWLRFLCVFICLIHFCQSTHVHKIAFWNRFLLFFPFRHFQICATIFLMSNILSSILVHHSYEMIFVVVSRIDITMTTN